MARAISIMKLFVRFSFSGVFDPGELSQLLGIEPTFKKIGGKASNWAISSEIVENGDIASLSSGCVELLFGHEPALVKWMAEQDIDAHLLIALETPPAGTLHENWSLPPICIPAEVIRFLGVIGASVDVDEEYF